MNDTKITEEELNNMSLNELLNRAVDGMVKQGCRAGEWRKVQDKRKTVFNCVYLDSRGNRCAIGHLMVSGEEYNELDLDSLLDSDYCSCLPDLVYKNRELFVELQNFHDSGKSVSRSISLDSMKEVLPHGPWDNPNWQVWIALGDNSF